MQNKFLKSFLLFGVTIIMVTTSCKKLIDDAYQSPNAPVVVPVETILPGVIGGLTAYNSAAGTNYGLQIDDVLLGRYIQYWGSTSLSENYGTMGGTIGSDNTGGIWGAVYYGHGQNVQRIIQWGTEQQKWDFVGVAQAIRAWDWLELTNQYSDGILTEAFNTSLTQFDYNPQPQFYDSCRALCFRALGNLARTDGNVNNANLAQSDAYLNGGSISKWQKFVYGILARSYIYLSYKTIFKTNGYADSAIKYATLSCSTNADNILATFSTVNSSNGFNSYFGPTRSNVGTMRQGYYIANLMSGKDTTMPFKNTFDPRCWYMLAENAVNSTTDPGQNFVGIYPWNGMNGYLNGSTPLATYPRNFWRSGTQNATAGTNDSANYVFSNGGPWPIMTASEMQFVIAEAYMLKGGSNTTAALAAYQNAVNLNIDMLTSTYDAKVAVAHKITPAIKSSFLAAVVPTSAANLTLGMIMTQKYIALFGWGTHQTWTDIRKYHYTDLDPTTNNTKQVYAGFTPPSGANIISTNGGKLAYRCRPRYNSEYLYDIPSLTLIGAINADYITYQPWFAQQ